MSGNATNVTEVLAFRQAAKANGYRLVRVKACEKHPIGLGWQNGTADDLLFNVSVPENTGVLTSGLIALDLDIDDRSRRDAVLEALGPHLPPNSLIKQRSNSPRITYILRAANGAPKKRVVGAKGLKIEVLGDGQQVLAHGIHPSGVAVEWLKDRSPATVPLSEIGAISEEQVELLLALALPILNPVQSPALTPRVKSPAAEAANAELAGGIASHGWFSDLTAQQKNEVVSACFDAIDNSREDPRDAWRDALFAAADAEVQGATEARARALDWSKRGAGWTSEEDFDTAWLSFKPGKGITVGTLLRMAQKSGLDLSPWRVELCARPQQAAQLYQTTPLAELAQPIRIHATPYLHTLPQNLPPRDWLYGTLLIRKYVSLLVAPGGVGKSALTIAEALSIASGKPLLGVQPVKPLRCWIWNGEDPADELQRRIGAAALHYDLRPADYEDNLFVDSGRQLPIKLGSASQRGAKIDQGVIDALARELEDKKISVLFIDPLVSIHTMSENDNVAMDMIAKALNEVADRANCAIQLAHHTRKPGLGETGVDDARGASSLLGSARVARALNTMSASEAKNFGVHEQERRRYFKAGVGKANLSLTGAIDWYRLQTQPLGNGDSAPVVTRWSPPVVARGLADQERDAVIKALSHKLWRENVKAADWIGNGIAAALGLDSADPQDRIRIKKIVAQLHAQGRLTLTEREDEHRKLRKVFEVVNLPEEVPL